MNRIISPFLFFILFTSLGYSQNTPLIKVEGQATVSAVPELMIIRIPVESQALEYQECAKKLTSIYNQLESAIVKAGYNKNSLKNSGLSVNERYTYNGQSRVKDGYTGNMSIHIETEFTDYSLNDMIEILSSPEFNFGFSLSYKLTDNQRKMLSSEALKEAVSDARMKASIMADAIGKALGSVLEMNYNAEEFRRDPVMYDSMMKAESGSVPDVSLNPTEIQISRSVIIHYQIASKI